MSTPRSTLRDGGTLLRSAICLALTLIQFSTLRAQTVIQGYEVQTWAAVTDPFDLSVASDGTMFVGRDASGSGGTSSDAVAIHRITANGSVTTFGPAIADPDTVVFDPDGMVGAPGSVLVGGSAVGGGQIVEVDVLENASPLFGPSPMILNPSDLVLEASGDLLVADYSQGKVFRLTNLVPSVIISASGNPQQIAVESSTGNLAVSWADGVIRRYAPNGTLLDNAFGQGRALAYHPVTGDLWTVNETSDMLQRIGPDGTVTSIGSGFETVWGMGFDGTGNLFVTEFDNDRVLRVRPVGVWSNLGGGTTGIAGQPTLAGTGSLIGGTTASVSLTNAPPSAPMLAWISLAPTPFMALGGTVHAFPFASQLFLFADGAGRFGASTAWPAGAPAGTDVYFQFIVRDLSVPAGLTLSNGVLATMP